MPIPNSGIKPSYAKTERTFFNWTRRFCISGCNWRLSNKICNNNSLKEFIFAKKTIYFWLKIIGLILNSFLYLSFWLIHWWLQSGGCWNGTSFWRLVKTLILFIFSHGVVGVFIHWKLQSSSGVCKKLEIKVKYICWTLHFWKFQIETHLNGWVSPHQHSSLSLCSVNWTPP